MNHDVFISYSNRDRRTADAVCHALEAAGLRCWMAPRDVPAGLSWKRSIVEAIRDTQVMVLIFSGEANGSSQVQREVDIAFEAGRPILPFRIEEVEMNEDLYFCIAQRHWLDALTPPLERHIERLVQAVTPLVSSGRAKPVEPSPSVEAPAPLSPTPGSDGGGERPYPSGETPPPPAAAPHPAGTPTAKPPPLTQDVSPAAQAAIRKWTATLGRQRLWMAGAGVLVAALLLGFWFAAGSDAGDLNAQAVEAYEAEQYEEALPLFREAAEQGHAEAQYYLGRMYEAGEGVEQDYQEALKWLRMSAGQDNASGQNGLGYMYLNGNGVPEDDAEALKWIRMAVAQGNARGQNTLGWMYFNGRGVEQDDAEALEWYRKAADQGHADAQANVGWMYATGEGVPVDHTEALKWYRMAAEQGNAFAQHNIGWMYDTANGVPEDDAEALKWYRIAADQNYADAQYNLGLMYANGDGVPEDDAEALKWYRMAAEQGHALAQYAIGWMYHTGEGVPEDLSEALKWYREAAAQDNANAESNIHKVLGNWVLAPLIPGVWQTLTEPERRAEIERLHAGDLLDRFSEDEIRRVRKVDLNFYDDATLFEAEVDKVDSQPGVVGYIRAGDDVVMIDGVSTQIHELSRTAPLRIHEMNQAVAFLRFFVGAIQGEESRFTLIDAFEDLHWLPDASAGQQESVRNEIAPLEVSPHPSGGWQATGTIQYARTLFTVNFRLPEEGLVEMTDDRPFATDLGLAVERYDDGVRVLIEDETADAEP